MNTIRSATTQMRLDQRAWIGFVADNISFVNANEITQLIVFTNSGKTPAFNVRMKSEGRLIPHGMEVTPPDYMDTRSPVGEGQSASTMPPGSARQIFVPSVKFTADGINQLRSGTIVFYQFGYVTYDDVFERSHRMTFCVFILPSLTGTGDCTEYNHAD